MGIVFVCSDEQVIRVYAFGIVAGMTDQHSIRDFSAKGLPREPGSRYLFPLEARLPSSIGRDGSIPIPTSGFFVDQASLPEPSFVHEKMPVLHTLVGAKSPFSASAVVSSFPVEIISANLAGKGNVAFLALDLIAGQRAESSPSFNHFLFDEIFPANCTDARHVGTLSLHRISSKVRRHAPERVNAAGAN